MKTRFQKIKLKWKIFVYILGFCALLLLILWVFQIVLLNFFYQQIKIVEIKGQAASIADRINEKNLAIVLKKYSKSNDIYIEVDSSDGTMLESSTDTKYKIPLMEKMDLISMAEVNSNEYYKHFTSLFTQQPEPVTEPDGQNNNRGIGSNNGGARNGEGSAVEKNTGNVANSGKGSTSVNGKDSIGKPGMVSRIKQPPNGKLDQTTFLAYVKLVNTSAGEERAVFINAVISPVNATVVTLRYQLYFVTVILVILSILLAFIIARRISKPIEEINKSAKAMAIDSGNIHFNATGFLEIGELSDTLNKTVSELNKAEALRRELLANISHDLRTPLSLIYSYAEMIHDFPEEIAPEQTQIIMDEVQRLKALVDDLLDISKLESGVQGITRSEFNLTDSVRGISTRVGEFVRKNGYQISFVYEGEVIVSGDEARLGQVLYNMLINAVNHSGEDRTIIVRQITSKESVRIEVEDTGEGIAPEDLPHIWDRYYKVDKKHRRAILGSGLGLSIVKKVMELHGGSYGVESEVGIGSCFWFELDK